MSTIRVNKVDIPFVQIDKRPLRDKNLSWKAKGLLSYLLSLPDDWKVYVNELKNHSKDGRDSTRSAIEELLKAGYMIRNRVHNSDGTFAGYDYTVFEISTIYGKPENGLSENGLSENGKPVTTNNNNTDNNNTNNKESGPTHENETFSQTTTRILYAIKEHPIGEMQFEDVKSRYALTETESEEVLRDLITSFKSSGYHILIADPSKYMGKILARFDKFAKNAKKWKKEAEPKPEVTYQRMRKL